MKFVRNICSIFLLTTFSAGVTIAQGTTASRKQVVRGPVGTSFFLYAGTFTGNAFNGHPDGGTPSKGIYMSRFDARTGALSAPVLAAEEENPTFLAVSPNQRFLYATTEGGPQSFVSAFAIDAHTGQLHLLNRVLTGGMGTTYVSTDRTGKVVLLANYGSSSVTAIQVEADGSLGRETSFVEQMLPHIPGAPMVTPVGPPIVAHPHSTIASPGNHFVLVPDLGLNKLFLYKFDAGKGVLELPATIIYLPSNEEPRHFVFSPDGRFGYLNAQTKGDVEVFSWDESTGTFMHVQSVSSFPKGLDAHNMSGEIGITPDGKFVYVSNRRTHDGGRELGPDNIVAYQVNQETGELTEVQDTDLGASIPRCFTIDPTGGYIAMGGQQSNRISMYRIDHESGKLTDSGVSVSIHTPACMQFARAQ